jgi:hypothetical protein
LFKAHLLTYLMVALTQGLTSELTPDISPTFFALRLCLVLDSKCTLHGSLDITTRESKAESGTGLSHKVKSHFGKALGLKVRNNRATTQTAMPHHMHDLTIAFVGESKLKASFCSVNTEDTGTSFAIKTEELIFNNTLGVEWIVERSNGSGVSRGRENVLDVMYGCVNKELRVGASSGTDIPCSRLNTHIVADGAELFKLTIGNDDSILAENGHLRTIR